MSKPGKPTNRNTKTYYVKGMHCASCEVLVEKEITKIDGVEHVNVSLKKNCMEIVSQTTDFPEVEHLNTVLSDLGYSVTLDKPVEQKLSRTDIYKTIGVFVLFVIAFYVIEQSGLFLRFSLTSSSTYSSFFVFGLVAGLSSCAALVGGLLLSLSAQWNTLYNGNAKQSYKPFLYFNFSRILAFGFFGGLLGLVGSYIGISIGFSVLISLLISLLMLVIGFQMLNIGWFKKFKLSMPKSVSKHISDETKFKGKYMPLFIGAMTFFLPCGFTLIAQSTAILSGSFTQGALMLIAFALGTLPILLLISFSSVKFYANPKFAKKFNLFSGMLIVFFALYTINSQLNVLGLPSLSDITTAPIKTDVAQVSGGTQLMQMEAIDFEYYPKAFTLQAGVPTRWEIYNNGAVGCSQAVYARGLYPEVIYLTPGLNVVEFTPEKPGTYKISCSMGMVPPVTVTVL